MGKKNHRRWLGKSNVMYCVRLEIQFVGDAATTTVYLRFRPHSMAKGYSPWTEDVREAKFWLYKTGAYNWLNMDHPHLTGEVLMLERDDAVLQAQKGRRC